jgi:hypothetical protein
MIKPRPRGSSYVGRCSLGWQELWFTIDQTPFKIDQRSADGGAGLGRPQHQTIADRTRRVWIAAGRTRRLGRPTVVTTGRSIPSRRNRPKD